MKKVITFVLSLCMILGLMPVANVFAVDEQPAMYLFKDVLRASFNHVYQAKYPYRKPVDIISNAGAKANAYAPFDCKVVKIEENEANMVGLVSLNPVRFANGEVDYMTIMVAHDNDISDMYVGKTYKQGDVFYQQGDVPLAFGNHIHLEAARGAFKSGSIWQYVRSADNVLQPNEVFYLYDDTWIVSTGGRTWNRLSGSSISSGNSDDSRSIGRTSKPTVSVDNNNSSVTVTWNSVANADHYDVYLVQAPWGWEDIKYAASSWDTSYTFWNVRDGDYQTFVIARPNKDTIQSEWTSLSVKKAQKIPMEVVSSVSSVTIDSRDFSLQVGETKQLKAGVVGSGDISFDKIWSSSNSGVASVDSNGLVTAKSAGRATIKAESVSDRGKYDSVEVEVVASTPATEPTPTPTVYPGKTNRPSVSVNGSDVSVSWNAIENAQYYDVYFVEAPWGWNNLRYGQSTPGTSYTFKDVADGEYAAFVIAKPNDDSVQSPWQHFSVKTAPTPTANFYNINASNVSQTNAQLNASISYSGNRPYEVGVYFGDSPNSMWRVGSDAINHSKNPFDMWYSLNKYGVTLSPGTTYYYQMYAAFEDTEIKSNVASFTTPAAASYGNVVTARVSGTPGGLAINSQPNKNYKIGRMDEGVYCTIDLDRTSGNWYYVTYNGVSGYAYNRYLVIQ